MGLKIEELAKIDFRTQYKQGDTVRLAKDCKTPNNKFKKNEEFIVEDLKETTLYLINEKGGLTIHRFLSELIQKL
jgi:hypothetical protein